MKNIYISLFSRIYFLMKETPGKRSADDAASWLLALAIFFYTSPMLMFFLDRIFGKIQFLLWISIVLIYAYVLFKLNSLFFMDNTNQITSFDRFKNESKSKRIFGSISAVAFILLSFWVFFLLLRIL